MIAEQFSSRAAWKKHQAHYRKFVQDLSLIAQSALRARTNKEFLGVYTAWTKSITTYADIILAPYAIERHLDPECRKSVDEASFSIISTPEVLNEFQHMRLKIIQSRLTGRPTPQQLAEHYAWYSEYSFIEPLLDARYFAEEVKKLTPEAARHERREMQKNVKFAAKEYLRVRKEIGATRVVLLADIIHAYTHLRTDRLDQWKKTQTALRIVFDTIAHKLAKASNRPWTRKDVTYCMNEEITEFLRCGKLPNYDTVHMRSNNQYVYFYEEGKPRIVQEQAFLDDVTRVIARQEGKDETIHGTIAHKGKVTGIVVLVHGKEDLPKVKEGNILVAKVTMPDYAPAMKKAAAFVTEEGGITSHAAIIARELKKPCIVGTGNCTRMLKEGDLVEVDADKGKVHIMKRAQHETSS